MNYENIVGLINDKIRENEHGYITGSVLNLVLRSIVEATGSQDGLMGIATPDTVPSEEPDSKQYWFAVEAGDYSKFGEEYGDMPEGLWLYQRAFVGDTDEMRWEAVNLGVYLKGKDGYTPIKGVDYFDGKDGKDGKDGGINIPRFYIEEGEDGRKHLYCEVPMVSDIRVYTEEIAGRKHLFLEFK